MYVVLLEPDEDEARGHQLGQGQLGQPLQPARQPANQSINQSITLPTAANCAVDASCLAQKYLRLGHLNIHMKTCEAKRRGIKNQCSQPARQAGGDTVDDAGIGSGVG